MQESLCRNDFASVLVVCVPNVFRAHLSYNKLNPEFDRHHLVGFGLRLLVPSMFFVPLCQWSIVARHT